ncbi:MAG: SUMF1/EgtB/PvdO family nonheme iron enzyme [Candidatus Competibacter sp.]|nr:SUMF1/EgtB/PvdO family nonheme iron enzyme [Candidatus Competibacter sp.]MDG4582989.1 SUMF1/EgtB/PvdO family nonheme iron enzyme [Candidatus Competibacter sp.]
MNIEARLEELAEAYAAGRLDEAELAHRQEALLREATSKSSTDDVRSAVGGLAIGVGIDPQASPLWQEQEPETLETGMVIGPAERQVRLLHDLSGRGRIWLVRIVVPGSKSGDGAEGDFRAIKLFLPAGSLSGSRESGRDERALRADLIGLRAYLTKVRARVEQAAKLVHPSIAGIEGWRHGADGWAFAEMEYIDHRQGHTFGQLLREQGQGGLPWETVLQWLAPVAAALDYAREEHRLPHQHLDPDMVFSPSQGEIKLLGFGLASEPREPRSVLFNTGGSVGESGAEGAVEPVTASTAFRRDVFALALLVYRALAGRSAYEAQGGAPNLVPRPPGLTDDAWRVLRRGLAYPSELCPTEAGQFINALDAAQRPTMLAHPGLISVLSPRWMLAAGLGLAVVVAIVWLATRPHGVPEPGQPEQVAAGETLRETEAPAPAGNLSTSYETESATDLRAFEAAGRVNTLLAYRLYLQRCPRCGYEKEARKAILKLETQQKAGELKTKFETLAQGLEQESDGGQDDQALAVLNALAKLTPDDPFIADGRRRVVLVWTARARTSLDRSDLDEARRWFGKLEAMRPPPPELMELTRRLGETEAVDKARRLDIDAFATARRANTREAYWTYLDRCAAACGHRAEAETALARLSPNNPLIRDRLNDGSQGPEMVVIPAGGFLMGSPASEKGRYSDEPLHSVRIAKPFAIGKYEVMFHEYDRFATATGRALPPDQGWGRSRRPVINVSWRDAVAYAEWLSQQTGQRYRLPTEAEWEYAARAGTRTSRYWGDDPDHGCAYANAADLDGKRIFVGWTAMNCRDGHVYTAPTGSYRSNDFGLHDMAGNVLEWTCSLYSEDPQAPLQSCEEPVVDRQFVARGGSWNDEPRNVRLADRHRSDPKFQDYFQGFRLVRELP